MICAATVFVLSVASLVQGDPSSTVFKQAQEKWRDDYAKGLQRPQGWLSVAGLFWLKEGNNTFGSDEDSAVRLPARVCMPLSGTLTRAGDKVTLDVIPGVEVLVNDKRATKMLLKSDAEETPDRLQMGDVMFRIIQR